MSAAQVYQSFCLHESLYSLFTWLRFKGEQGNMKLVVSGSFHILSIGGLPGRASHKA